MRRFARYLGQAALYAAFAAVIGYFSSAPAWQHFDPAKALIKVAFTHAAKPIRECRRRTAAEIAKLPPNMRRPLDCPRERVVGLFELELDGRLLLRVAMPPSGLWKDGAATVYRRLAVAAGDHVLTARLRESNRAQGFDYQRTAAITLAPRQNFVVDFHADAGGFIFR